MRFISYLLFITVTGSYSQTLRVDEHRSTITFHVRNFGIDVKGTLAGASGSIVLDTADLSLSSFRLSADASSIDTDISLRDRHLRGSDYLDVTTYPRLEFVSTEVTRTLAGEIMVKGKLTIKNISKEITVPLRVSVPGMTVNFAGSFTINRLDYNVGMSSISLADQVRVQFLISAGLR